MGQRGRSQNDRQRRRVELLSQRRAQRAESRLIGEQAALFPPQRPLNAARDGGSESRVFWGITPTSGSTTRKQMSFSGFNLAV